MNTPALYKSGHGGFIIPTLTLKMPAVVFHSFWGPRLEEEIRKILDDARARLGPQQMFVSKPPETGEKQRTA